MGLHQGDPLLPYLFILGVEVLTRMIKREQRKGKQGKLFGYPLGGGQGRLGHLLYADDCLLVVWASIEEAGVVSDVLKEYYYMSGQWVNKCKS